MNLEFEFTLSVPLKAPVDVRCRAVWITKILRGQRRRY